MPIVECDKSTDGGNRHHPGRQPGNQTTARPWQIVIAVALASLEECVSSCRGDEPTEEETPQPCVLPEDLSRTLRQRLGEGEDALVAQRFGARAEVRPQNQTMYEPARINTAPATRLM